MRKGVMALDKSLCQFATSAATAIANRDACAMMQQAQVGQLDITRMLVCKEKGNVKSDEFQENLLQYICVCVQDLLMKALRLSL